MAKNPICKTLTTTGATYTVPAGKHFVGQAFAADAIPNNGSITITPVGETAVYLVFGSNGTTTTQRHGIGAGNGYLVLTSGGTIVRGGSNSGTCIVSGYEYDN
ncbi:hypothetical protein [Maritalea porphyrae]|uniref:hypothetical protein n=1 Tax=Maritalea porphyrae TaxID=880732 RepID=UPI0022B0671F|nr:hypothetical protein [Maritalea porphyrae]MCZ4273291.1 hypothetical protein [Maritalea porphyrae]